MLPLTLIMLSFSSGVVDDVEGDLGAHVAEVTVGLTVLLGLGRLDFPDMKLNKKSVQEVGSTNRIRIRYWTAKCAATYRSLGFNTVRASSMTVKTG